MKRLKTISLMVAVLLLLLFGGTRVWAQGSTSKGTEFWTTWMDHINGAVAVGTTGPSKMSLYITSDVSTSGSITIADGSATIPNFTVTANQVTIVDIPPSAYVGAVGNFLKGIHITSLKPIAVYAHIYANAVSGATLLLPVNTLGKNYYSINYTQVSNSNNSYSAFAVVATEDNTTIEVTPSAKLNSPDTHAANQTFIVALSKGEVYQGLSPTDLTGTKIRSISSAGEPCKKIAVFSGSGKVAIGCPGVTSPLTSDNLFQQVYPIASWGKNYITAPLKSRNFDVYRIVLSDPTTKVTLNGTPVTQFVNNLYYEFNSATTNVISADKPIQVVQYSVTQGRTLNCVNDSKDVGDPEMIYITPIEQSLDHVTLYSTNQYLITKNFINVIIPHSAAASFTVDGSTTGVLFTPVTGNTIYDYAQIQVDPGTHNISASLPFNAIAYGFGNAESYGYAAGTNLKNLNEFIELKEAATNTASASGCVGVTYKPQINIPYQTSKISWDLKDGNAAVVTNPTAPDNTIVKNGQTLYVYSYPSTVTYTTAGSYVIVATVLNPTADDCGSNEDIEFDYIVSDIPNAKFSTSVGINGICPGNEVAFTDETATNGVATKTWSWHFGDDANATVANPNTATNANPKHIYTVPGDYQVTLTVENQNGCATTSLPQTIHVNKAPTADFGVSDPDCETRGITFDPAKSLANEGTLNKWVWDFGDGTPVVTKTDNLPFTHTFALADTYQVSLTVTSSTGCVSDTKIIPVVIHPLPKTDFVTPDVCISDSFAQFKNISAIADGTALTYVWNFGDPKATPANNTSTDTNPKHIYTQANEYTATLTTTSIYGCVTTTAYKFTVNGATPKALFDTKNLGNTFCSSEDVLFKDNSTVDFGIVTKIEWYFDAVNKPNDVTVYTKDQFPVDRIFRHNYGLFSDVQSKTYHVKMVVYSGGICQSSIEDDVTIYANPSIDVSPVNPTNTLCQEAVPVQIKATVQYGVGKGVFSGKGVSPDGLFDPAKAGPGKFTITYLFTSDNTGCTYGTNQDITVYPTPKANAGTDLHVLQGGNIIINASADGNKPLKYKWTLADGNPATGLDHDDVLSPVASPADDVTYMFTVTSADGCTASSNVHVTVLKAPVVPNAFTPNNDGTNDRWEIKYLDTYPNCTIDIYNRYGEKLYSSIGYQLPWDGTYKGAVLPVGTYYYIINPKNGRKVITGSVTIIR